MQLDEEILRQICLTNYCYTYSTFSMSFTISRWAFHHLYLGKDINIEDAIALTFRRGRLTYQGVPISSEGRWNLVHICHKTFLEKPLWRQPALFTGDNHVELQGLSMNKRKTEDLFLACVSVQNSINILEKPVSEAILSNSPLGKESRSPSYKIQGHFTKGWL